MNNYTLLNWVIVIGIICFILIIKHSRKEAKKEKEVNSKQEPKIYLAEKYIGIDEPIAIHGYIDRAVWEKEHPEDKKEKIVIEELKNRTYAKVFEPDIIQLSVYKYILKRIQKDGEVSERAKVYVQTPEGKQAKYVDLYSDEKIEELYKRYKNLDKGDVVPKEINNINYCKKCPHFQKHCYPDVNKKGSGYGKRN